jgi:adenosylhomocysteine nucleosidase
MKFSESSFALVCFALEGEARPFRIKLNPRCRWQIVTTGMGQANARRAIQTKLAQLTPALVLTCGLAGGLNPNLRRGIVVGEADEAFPLASSFTAAGIHPGRFYCASKVVATAAAKTELWRQSNADVVDMESAEIRQECRRQHIPSATVRVISDAADEDLPLDFNQYLDTDCRFRYLKLLAAVMRSPAKIHALLLFQRQSKQAARVLADALFRVLEPFR